MRLAMPFLKNISPMKSSLIISIASPRFKIISKKSRFLKNSLLHFEKMFV